MNEFYRRLLFLPQQASTLAPKIDHLHYFIITTAMVAATAIAITGLFFFVRYRQRYPTQTTPIVKPKWYHEAFFVGTPLAFFLLWFFIGFPYFVSMHTPPKEAMDVFVQGKKWMWQFAYPGGPNAIDVLRVPAGRPVRLLITSRDVIHSFFVPAFRIKQDAVPGRYTEIWFQATTPGRYQIFCAEYCGVGHSSMLGEVVVMKPEEFDPWLADQRRGVVHSQDSAPVAEEDVDPRTSLVDQGRRIAAEQGCFKCHTVDGTRHIGPTWLDLYRKKEMLDDGSTIVADEAYLTESMMDPRAKIVAGYQPVMPTFQGKLSAPDAAAIVEFIKSLRTDAVQVEPSKGPVYAPIPPRR